MIFHQSRASNGKMMAPAEERAKRQLLSFGQREELAEGERQAYGAMGWRLDNERVELIGPVRVKPKFGAAFLAEHVGFGWFVEVGFDVVEWSTSQGIPTRPYTSSARPKNGRTVFISQIAAWKLPPDEQGA